MMKTAALDLDLDLDLVLSLIFYLIILKYKKCSINFYVICKNRLLKIYIS